MLKYALEEHLPEIAKQIDCAFRLGHALAEEPYLGASSHEWGITTVEKLPPAEDYGALYIVDSQGTALNFWSAQSDFTIYCDDSLKPRAIEFCEGKDEITVIHAQDMNPDDLKKITNIAVDLIHKVLEINQL